MATLEKITESTKTFSAFFVDDALVHAKQIQ